MLWLYNLCVTLKILLDKFIFHFHEINAEYVMYIIYIDIINIFMVNIYTCILE